MVSASGVRTLLDDRPDLDQAVEQVLEADEPFTFDEIDVDTGQFGEIVDADIVEKTDDGYVVTDRRAVRRGVAGDVTDHTDERSVDWSLPTPEPTLLAALAAVTGFVILLRLVPLPNVFQDGAVVLSANDPYYYRYWVERLLRNPPMALASLPEGVDNGEPLMVVTLWLVAELLGGTKTSAGWVLAWYPVVSALCTAILLYLLTVETTSDRRVGIAAVAMLAVIPGHAARTSVGFADHHAFDVPWLVLTALALVVLVGADLRSRRSLLGVVTLGLGVGAQTLSWEAGPLLLIPIGLIVLGRGLLAVRAGESPARSMAPTLAGLALGAAVVLAAHVVLGWHTRTVALAPTLLLAGSIAVVAVAAAARGADPDDRYLIGGIVGTGVLGLAVVAIALPGVWNEALGSLTGQLFREGDIGETKGLFAASVGWLLWFGLVLAVAIPYMAWGTAKLFEDARWTVPVAYGWYLLVLAGIQARFITELAAFTAVFAGLGFVHLAERVGAARRPAVFQDAAPIDRFAMPGLTQIRTVFLLFLLITGLSIVQVGITAHGTATPPEQYRTADWMADYAADQAWTYPDNYVFSHWNRNRMYNYFVNGQSRSYGFAQARYLEFIRSTNAEQFYDRRHSRIGFVVYNGEATQPGTVGRALAAYGSRHDEADGLQHYRAVFVSENAQYKVFVLVAGANITGTAQPDSVLTVASEETVSGRTFTYERRVRTDANGHYHVTVPYPGEYTIDDTSVSVAEQAVNSGENISVSE